jgi:glycosyltransferase involved in cell wall biosynthesis
MSSPDLPLVSVITAVFNGQQYMVNCIESVLQQDYPNVEYIVIDGGSSDGTIDLLRRYNDRIAFWSSEPDQGVYDAWNKGLRIARGEWICFVGADDEFLPGAISAYMQLAAQQPEAEYLSSRERWVHSSGYERLKGGPWSWKKFSRWNCASHVGSMHRRSLFDRLGTYNLSFGPVADYELLLRAGDRLRTAYIPTVTAKVRAGGMTDTRNALAEATRAKILTGRRNILVAKAELWFANLKYPLRPLRRVIGRLAP